ncbi:MAG TPA: phosphopantothenoylcysteine decarboxylase [Candidatus Paceibacterota bacterium]|nr:phosphopantothenoylcysteine decarboxylase [Candidatus Paceibacterota bacterium]
MTKKILITGGPVHAYLDDVKIITNRFKGGLMSKLAGEFVDMAENLHAKVKVNRGDKKADVHITYLCSKNSQQPWYSEFLGGEKTPHLTCVHHNGIDDYMEKVLELAPQMDAIVLGAAVANLIPKNKIKGKFPSHNYKPGDTIPIEFTIAPRIIDEVKKANPKVHLFGYKLLSGVSYPELISAAYGVLLESKAVTVFANDAMDLMQKYAVTKERGVHPMLNKEVSQWILDRMDEQYYSTEFYSSSDINLDIKNAKQKLKEIIDENKKSFLQVDEGYVFGSAAYSIGSGSVKFATTSRGKNEINDLTFVKNVDHDQKTVLVEGNKKATLNAPLFYRIFKQCSTVKYILHFHYQRDDLITQEYATPGTDKDSFRPSLNSYLSFNIKGHGCILSYNKEGKLLK